MSLDRRRLIALGTAALAAAALPPAARAAEREAIDARINLALARLRAEVAGADRLLAEARGVLVMPAVVKGGFLLGGAYGEGALRLNTGDGAYGPSVGYWSVAAASLGLQAGIQETAQALFFMTDAALAEFRASDGWEAGADAEVTMIDKALNIGVDTAVLNQPVVALVWGGSGLMLGASVEGSKYSPIRR